MKDGQIDFETVWESARRAISLGRLEEAESLIQGYCAWARGHGEERQLESAVCALAALAIQLGRGEPEVPRLREILVRGADLNNCRLAAYHISLYYELVKNYKKSLFYARLARDKAELLGRSDWLAFSCNQLGNALLGESFVDDARRQYEQALELLPSDPTVWRATVLYNLGYCHILKEHFRKGYSLLYQSLRILRRFGSERYQILPLLDLAFAHLETGRFRHAWRRALTALKVAERTDHVEGVKNALYLLGEASKLKGDLEAARGYFKRLHDEFFPTAGYLPGFLLEVNVRRLINLHA